MMLAWSIPDGLRLAGSVLAVPPRDQRGFAKTLVGCGLDIHVDLIDDSYPRRHGVHPALVPALLAEGLRPLEVHVLMADPARAVADLLRGTEQVPDRIIVQAETLPPADNTQVRRLAASVRARNAEFWLGIDPGVDPHTAPRLPAAGVVDGVLVMLTPPGDHATHADTSRLTVVRRLARQLPVGVDGGVIPDLLPAVRKAGASYAVSGRALARAVSHDPRKGAL